MFSFVRVSEETRYVTLDWTGCATWTAAAPGRERVAANYASWMRSAKWELDGENVLSSGVAEVRLLRRDDGIGLWLGRLNPMRPL